MLIGVCVSCRFSCSIVSYLYVSCSGSITSVGEERAYFSACDYTCGFCNEWILLPLGAWDGRCHLFLTLPWPSI